MLLEKAAILLSVVSVSPAAKVIFILSCLSEEKKHNYSHQAAWKRYLYTPMFFGISHVFSGSHPV